MTGYNATSIARRLRACLQPQRAAGRVGLVYVEESLDGIRRIRRGKGFSYATRQGRPVRDPATLERIRSLAIPPAWNSVWICDDERGHIQAIGLDFRGRKQYRYHPRWREIRDATKFDRMPRFAEVLSPLRRRLSRALTRPGLSRERIVATVIRLLDVAHLRIGNAEYAEANGSFGLTTLRDRHAEIHGADLKLEFRGKSGIPRVVQVRDRRLAKIVRRCSELPGQMLFQYLDDAGRPRRITSTDVNRTLRSWTGADFSAKDFRTWAGTVEFVRAVQDDDGRARFIRLVKRVARVLGNTPTVCRKFYIHPVLLNAYQDGVLPDWIADASAKQRLTTSRERRLSRSERLTLKLLKKHSLASSVVRVCRKR